MTPTPDQHDSRPPSFACFYGNCLHSVMPNYTDEIRRGIIYRAIRQDALDEMERLGLG